MNKYKNLMLVMLVSFAVTGLVIFLIFLDKANNPIRFISSIILIIWSFFIIPSYCYSIEYLNKKTFEESFQIGYRLGIVFGFSFLILPILISPFLGILWYKEEITIIKNNK